VHRKKLGKKEATARKESSPGTKSLEQNDLPPKKAGDDQKKLWVKNHRSTGEGKPRSASWGRVHMTGAFVLKEDLGGDKKKEKKRRG